MTLGLLKWKWNRAEVSFDLKVWNRTWLEYDPSHSPPPPLLQSLDLIKAHSLSRLLTLPLMKCMAGTHHGNIPLCDITKGTKTTCSLAVAHPPGRWLRPSKTILLSVSCRRPNKVLAESSVSSGCRKQRAKHVFTFLERKTEGLWRFLFSALSLYINIPVSFALI